MPDNNNYISKLRYEEYDYLDKLPENILAFLLLSHQKFAKIKELLLTVFAM